MGGNATNRQGKTGRVQFAHNGPEGASHKLDLLLFFPVQVVSSGIPAQQRRKICKGQLPFAPSRHGQQGGFAVAPPDEL